MKSELPNLPPETQWKYRTTGYTATQMREYALLVARNEREKCAFIALNEPRVWDYDAKDPQQRIAEKILARSK